MVSRAAGPIVKFAGSRRWLARTARFGRELVPKLPRGLLECVLYAVGGNADSGPRARYALDTVERCDRLLGSANVRVRMNFLRTLKKGQVRPGHRPVDVPD